MNNSNRREGLMSGLLLLSGAIIGSAITALIYENKPKAPAKVLELARKEFSQDGDLVGSWIDYDPVEYELFDSRPLVYIGGVSIDIGNQVHNYQFAADVYSGDIIDSFELDA